MDERTKEIVRRFTESWLQTGEWLDDLINNHDFQQLKPVRQLMLQMEERGEHQYFRAGTSVHTLLLSRSVNFGLRTDQKYIKIEAFMEGDFEVTMRDGEKTYRQYKVNDLNDNRVMKLIDTLKHTLID